MSEEKSEEKIEATTTIMQEEIDLKRMVPPHDKKSRSVTEKDADRVVAESTILYRLCFIPNGKYRGAFAMHHSQIDDKDPLNFFVTAERKIVINPTITRHSNYFVDSKEACMSFPEEDQIMVKRWQKMEVEYVSIMVDSIDKDKFKLSNTIQESLSGFESFVFQHEFDHGGEGKLIYPLLTKK